MRFVHLIPLLIASARFAFAQEPSNPTAAPAGPLPRVTPALDGSPLSSPAPPTNPAPEEKPIVSITKSTWTTSGFGSIAIWKVTLENQTGKAVGNFRWQTRYSSETGVELRGDSGDLLKLVKPHSKRTFEINTGFISTQVTRGTIDIGGGEFVRDNTPDPTPNSNNRSGGSSYKSPGGLKTLSDSDYRRYGCRTDAQKRAFDINVRLRNKRLDAARAATGSMNPRVVDEWLRQHPVQY